MTELKGMKKSVNLDPQLLADARTASGAATDADTIRLGLEALIRHDAYQRLAAMLGQEIDAKDIPRRREPPVRRRKAA